MTTEAGALKEWAGYQAKLALASLLVITGPVDHYEENVSILEAAILEGVRKGLEMQVGFLASRFRQMYDGENDLAKRIYVAHRKDLDALLKDLKERTT